MGDPDHTIKLQIIQVKAIRKLEDNLIVSVVCIWVKWRIWGYRLCDVLSWVEISFRWLICGCGSSRPVVPSYQGRETDDKAENPCAQDQQFGAFWRHDVRVGDGMSHGDVAVQALVTGNMQVSSITILRNLLRIFYKLASHSLQYKTLQKLDYFSLEVKLFQARSLTIFALKYFRQFCSGLSGLHYW